MKNFGYCTQTSQFLYFFQQQQVTQAKLRETRSKFMHTESLKYLSLVKKLSIDFQDLKVYAQRTALTRPSVHGTSHMESRKQKQCKRQQHFVPASL
jgi:hypothetical protein